MRYIVFDLEWNQPQVRKKKIKDLHGEIIQIGAIALDENFNETDSFDVTIKPVYYTNMNKDVAELTHITQEEIDAGIGFLEAFESFRKWCTNECILISWSFSDMDMILNNFEKFKMDASWLPECYDAQLMFDDQFTQEDRDFPLNYALYYFGEKPEASHNALDDARSVAKILRHMDREECFIWEFAYFGDSEGE